MKEFTFQYKLRRETVRIAPFSFDLQVLVDFEETVDEMFIQPDVPQDMDLCPYFGTLWPAAHTLASEVAILPNATLHEREILEVGCGLGLPSMVAMKRGGNVTAMDFHPDAEAFFRQNLSLNELGPVTYIRADWLKGSVRIGQYHMIMGSDILYSAEQPLPLAQFIHDHLAPDGVAVITDPGRAYLQDFTTAMEKFGFKVSVEVKPVSWLDKVVEVFILTFQRQATASGKIP